MDTLAPGVALTCVNTNKFKTGCLSVNLVGKLSADTASSFALLPQVLRRGSAELPDMDRIASALDELYGARIEPIVRKKGELHCIGFYSDFPDDRFITGDGNILERVTELCFGILLSPNMRGGILLPEYVESEKSNLIDDIEARINDKRSYSIDRLTEEMCAGEAFGINKYGDISSVEAITAEALTAAHRDVLLSTRIEILYCGSAGPERVASALRPVLSILPGCDKRVDISIPDTRVVLYPPASPPRRFTESLDVGQSKLAVGFRLGSAMKGIPDYPAMMVFNAAYGSGDTSKLFLNIRERLSLCYYVGSMLEKHKGVMIVSSGIDSANYETTYNEILSQLNNIKNGDVSERELLSAKRSVITAIKSAMDRPAGLLDLYFDSSVSTNRYDPDELCGKVEAVTLERVVETSSEIEPDSIYLLEGKGGGDDDEL